MFPREGNQTGRPTAVMTLVAALLMQAMATGLHFRLISTSVAVDGSLYQKIIICTGLGLRQITLDANGNPVGDGKPVDRTDCPACHLRDGCAATEPATVGLAQPVLAAWIGHAPLGEDLIFGREPVSPNSRAPPLPA